MPEREISIRADLQTQLAEIDRQLELADENENPIERTWKRDSTVLELRDALVTYSKELRIEKFDPSSMSSNKRTRIRSPRGISNEKSFVGGKESVSLSPLGQGCAARILLVLGWCRFAQARPKPPLTSLQSPRKSSHDCSETASPRTRERPNG